MREFRGFCLRWGDGVGVEAAKVGLELDKSVANSENEDGSGCGVEYEVEADGGTGFWLEPHIRMKEPRMGREAMPMGADAERARVTFGDGEVGEGVKIDWGVFKSTGPAMWSSGSVSATSAATLSEARRLKLHATLTARWITVGNGEKTFRERV